MQTTKFMILLLVAGSANAANLVTVDFDSTLPTYFGLDTYQEDGMTLTSNVSGGTLIDNNQLVRNNIGITGTGSNSQSIFWGENGSTSTISVAQTNGLTFSLQSLDTSSGYNAAGTLTLTGTHFGGATLVQVLNLNDDLTTYNITGMNKLTSLDISFDGATYSAPYDLDNLVVNAVPIPAAVWLMGSALMGLFGFGRRRRAKLVSNAQA